MAHLKFRLLSIMLDAEEDVCGVTAIADDDAYKLITGLLGEPPETTGTARGDTEFAITLSLAQARKLFSAAGKFAPKDPAYSKGSHEIYDSLAAVFYGLMEE